MSTSRGGTGDLWVRLGLFVVAALVLHLLSNWAFAPLLAQLVAGSRELFLATVGVIGALPVALAAALAWLLPNKARGTRRGRPLPASRWVGLFAVCVVLAIIAMLAYGGTGNWGDSASVAQSAGTLALAWLVALPGSLLLAFAAVGVLMTLWERILPPAGAGLAAGLTLAVPMILSGLIASLGSENSALRSEGMLVWLAGTALAALFYSTLAGLLTGRAPVARVLLAGGVLAAFSVCSESLGGVLALWAPALSSAIGSLGLRPGQLLALLLIGGTALALGRSGAPARLRSAAAEPNAAGSAS
ncbi:hypothetical protein [Galactobacter valiniphilus]|uniref:hypothetical protein n=1 Tax=Galactobacter valiniphilus TaxID=2676122 RepID=UPI0037363CDD